MPKLFSFFFFEIAARRQNVGGTVTYATAVPSVGWTLNKGIIIEWR